MSRPFDIAAALSQAGPRNYSETNTSDVGAITIAAVVVLVLGIGGFLFAQWLRRRVDASAGSRSEGFSLASLRAMHRRGDLSDEEFERAKASILASVKLQQNPIAQARAERERVGQAATDRLDAE